MKCFQNYIPRWVGGYKREFLDCSHQSTNMFSKLSLTMIYLHSQVLQQAFPYTEAQLLPVIFQSLATSEKPA